MSDSQQLWERFRTVLTDGDAGWQKLVVDLGPELQLMARRQPIGRLRDREDTPREILTRVLARLHARDYAAIRKLCAMDPPPELRAWLRVLVMRSAIDYMREHPEFERGGPEQPPRWVSLASFDSSDAPPVDPSSLAEKRAELLGFVRTAVERAQEEFRAHGAEAQSRLALEWKIAAIHVRRLLARGDQYLAVLDSVLAGNSYPETATRLSITRREVELTVRYLEELLRARHFGVVTE